MKRDVFVLFFLVLFANSSQAEEFLYSPIESQAITCHFCGYRYASGNCHGAIDFDTTDSTTIIHASAEGEVSFVIDKQEVCRKLPYGSHVVIQHPNGYSTLYAHLKLGSIKVQKGETVEAGQEIAIGDNSGCSSGSHLHFEVRDPSGKLVDPYDAPKNQNLCLPDSIPQTCGQNHLWTACPPVVYDGSLDDQDGDGFTVAQGDCDDHDKSRNPGAFELCDGIDNDCNDGIDEDFQPTDYTIGLGSDCSEGYNDCRVWGKYVCSDDKTGVICDAVAKEPEVEICDNEDNDCDGKIDEDFKYKGAKCIVGHGACQSSGKYICSDDGDLVCNAPVISPDSEELCDGLDNDCDGDIDEDFPGLRETCVVGIGECRQTGKKVCLDFDPYNVYCSVGPLPSQDEICDDKKDNDCDGAVDEECPCSSGEEKSCGESSLGECSFGIQECVGGYWGPCVGAINPVDELCDGLDNDCDEEIDEDFSIGEPCTVGIGECEQTGQRVCLAHDLENSYCSVAPLQSEEEVCDGADNDCDGEIDNGDLCAGNSECVGGVCECLPDCSGKECGADGCGGSCGNCDSPPDNYCLDSNRLRRYTGSADCYLYSCEYDYINIVCDNGCDMGNGVCQGCIPDCSGKECGADGCGGSCGDCGVEENCSEGICVPCPDGWDYLPSTGNCYKLMPDKQSYINARAFCVSNSSHLATVSSSGENSFLYSLTDELLWIGFDDLSEEGVFSWVNGEPVTYVNWRSGEPNNEFGGEDCALLNYYSSSSWTDSDCADENRFACEITKCPGIALETPSDGLDNDCDGLVDEVNIALGKDYTVEALAYENTEFSGGEITDGSLYYSGSEYDDVAGWRNDDMSQLMTVKVTIDLGGTYQINEIRYNPGNVQMAEYWICDTMETPWGEIDCVPGHGFQGLWTIQYGNSSLDSLELIFKKERVSTYTDWFFIGEVEIYGIP